MKFFQDMYYLSLYSEKNIFIKKNYEKKEKIKKKTVATKIDFLAGSKTAKIF